MSKIKYLILLILLIGCDFSSGLHKDILVAQGKIDKRKFKEAALIYEKILSRKITKSIRIKMLYQTAEIYSVYLNDYSKALSHLNNIISESNEPLWQVKALERIGDIYFENQKKYTSSLRIYDKLRSFQPKLEKQDQYTFRFAQSLFYLGHYEESDKFFEELSSNSDFKGSEKSYYYLGLSSFYKKNWEVAINYWFEYLKREDRKDQVVKVKFMIANAYESSERLKEAYNIYYSIIGEYPNPEIIRNRLNSLYERRVARKR